MLSVGSSVLAYSNHSPSPFNVMALFIGLPLVLDGSQAIFVKPLTISPLSHTMK